MSCIDRYLQYEIILLTFQAISNMKIKMLLLAISLCLTLFSLPSYAQFGGCDSLYLALTATPTSSPATCDGGITPTVYGGTAPYTYTISPSGGAFVPFTNLCAGNYCVIVADANGCTAQNCITVTSGGGGGCSSFVVSATNTPSNLGTCMGSITLSTSGGTAPYVAQNVDGSVATFSGSTYTYTNLCAGTYNIVVTDNAGCTAQVVTTIASAGGGGCDSLYLSLTATPTSSPTACDGSITPTVYGGTAPYTYTISPSGGAFVPFTNLCAGNYCVIVADANGCTAQNCITVISGGGGDCNTLYLGFSVTSATSPTACDGMVFASAYNGTPPYSYIGAVSDDIPIYGGLCAGTHCFTAIDANGCTVQDCVEILSGDGDCSSFSVSTVASSGVPGTCTNSITIYPSGGTPPYAYTVASPDSTVTTYFNAPYTIENLCPGTYNIVLTDAIDCTAQTTEIITPACDSLYLSLTATVPTGGGACDGTITPTVYGGVAPYTYTISPAIGGVASFTNLCAGNYCVIVADANGCTAQNCIELEGYCNSFWVSTTNTPSTFGACTGSITLNPSGGTAPYVVQSSDGSVVTFSSSTYTYNNLCAGFYNMVVTDSAGCVNQLSMTLLSTGGTCDSIYLSLTATPTSSPTACDGVITPTVNGGTAPYTYSFLPGTGSIPPFTNLCPDTYYVYVADANGCMDQAYITVASGGGGCGDFVVSSTTTPTVLGACTGSITLATSGGTAPYVVQNADGSVATFGGSTYTDNNVCAGTYNMVVTDNTGCTAQVVTTVGVDTLFAPIVANNDVGYIDLGTALTINPLANDSGTGSLDIVSATVTPSDLCSIEIDFENDEITLITSADNPIDTAVISYVIIDATGAVATGTVTVYVMPACGDECVYPGDADDNGIANNFDVLQIGLTYDFNGTPRLDQSTDWYAHVAENWDTSFPDGLNHKFADCNGNGTVYSEDIAAIDVNYGLTHGKGEATSSSGIPLFFEPEVIDVIEGNDTLYLSVHLGDATTLADNFYGIAFTINYDATLVQYIGTDNADGSWVGDTTNTLLFSKNLSAAMKLDLCMTRIDHNNVAGSGAIARAKFVMIENIDGGKVEAEQSTFPFSFSDIRAIANDATLLDIAAQDIIISGAGQPNTSNNTTVKVFPNPSSDQLYVQTNSNDAFDVRIMNVAGQVVYVANKVSGLQTIQTQQWETGIYMLQLSNAQGSQVHKIIVSR
jgi:hypothetical protein